MARFVVPVAAPRAHAAGRHVFVSGRGLERTRCYGLMLLGFDGVVGVAQRRQINRRPGCGERGEWLSW